MSGSEFELEKARAQARDAREQIMDTVDEIKQRLAPSTLAEEVWEGVRDRGSQLAEDAVDLARARPAATAAVAATAVLLLARNPLMHAASSLFSRGGDEEPDASSQGETLESPVAPFGVAGPHEEKTG